MKIILIFIIFYFTTTKKVLSIQYCNRNEYRPTVYIDLDRCYDSYGNWKWYQKNNTHVVREWNCDRGCARCTYLDYHKLEKCQTTQGYQIVDKPLVGTDGFFAQVAYVKPVCRTDSEFWAYERFFNKSVCTRVLSSSYQLYWKPELRQIERLYYSNNIFCEGDVNRKDYHNLLQCSELPYSDTSFKASR
jgi:hypothetical protein